MKVHTIKVYIDLEVYIFRFTAITEVQARRTAGMFAADPELNFTWRHGAMVCKAIRDIVWKEQYGHSEQKI